MYLLLKDTWWSAERYHLGQQQCTVVYHLRNYGNKHCALWWCRPVAACKVRIIMIMILNADRKVPPFNVRIQIMKLYSSNASAPSSLSASLVSWFVTLPPHLNQNHNWICLRIGSATDITIPAALSQPRLPHARVCLFVPHLTGTGSGFWKLDWL